MSICLLFIWGNIVTNFTEISDVLIIEMNENANVAKITFSIKIVQPLFFKQINRKKKQFKDRKMMITVKDDETKDMICIFREYVNYQ